MAKKDLPPGLLNALLNGFDALAFRNDFNDCAAALQRGDANAKGQANALMNSIDHATTKRNANGFDNGNVEHLALAGGLDGEFGILRAIVTALRERTQGPRADLQWESAMLISSRLTRIVRATGGE